LGFSYFKAKVKINLSLCSKNHHAMYAYAGQEVRLHTFLILPVGIGDWSPPCSKRFTPSKTTLNTYCRGEWVNPTEILDVLEKRIILFPAKDRTTIS
jgi:hypothetical protein